MSSSSSTKHPTRNLHGQVERVYDIVNALNQTRLT